MSNSMPETQVNYTSYLLRLWRVNNSGRPVWRASLENTRTGERHGFADPASLFAFLNQVTQPPLEPQGLPEERPPP